MKNYIHHIVLTVKDSKVSADFYSRALDWKIKEQGKDYAYLAPDDKSYPESKFVLVLGERRDKGATEVAFDRNHIGLDHFAFAAESLEEIKKIEVRLKKLGIAMEDGGLTEDGFGGKGIFCQDPDGMKLEFHLE